MRERQLLRRVGDHFSAQFSELTTNVLRDAAELVRTIMGAVKYIHECGIVHRGQCFSSLSIRRI